MDLRSENLIVVSATCWIIKTRGLEATTQTIIPYNTLEANMPACSLAAQVCG